MRPEDDDANASASAAPVAIGTDQAPATASSVAPAGRRPYRAPTLRLLGCVRDLTLGGASGFAEGAGSFIRPKM